MELLIDTQRCDLPLQEIQLPRLDLSRLGEVAAHREGRTLSLRLPATPANDRIFGFARDPEAAPPFNHTAHEALLQSDGVVLMRGKALLNEASDEGYSLTIREGGTGWATQAALRWFNELQIADVLSLTPLAILQSWSNDSAIKYFPIHRDDYAQQMSGSDLLRAERMLTVDDYYPFLHLKTLIEQIFREAGYTVESRFLSSEFFRKLYMSGAYSSRDTTAAMNRMGFLARRLTTASAEADYRGRVYADPAALYHTIGNLVESASPLAVDEAGETLHELYANGHCFTIEDGRILFRPIGEVSVGFEYYLKYVTEHRIRSRTELTGFDSIYLPGCGLISAHLANRYEDHRSHVEPGFGYRALVFEPQEGAEYRLLITHDGVAGYELGRFTGRSARIDTPFEGHFENPVLQINTDAGWVDCEADWALYAGYIDEVGSTTVELRLHSPAELVTPDKPKFFDTIFFAGAEEGMSLTLDRTCSIRPLFRSTPGYGEAVDFKAVAHHEIRQIELLEAVAHLFNLRFVTDEERCTVRIEPSDVLYRTSQVVDWRTKVDPESPVRLKESAAQMHQTERWCYAVSDGAVDRFERQKGEVFGAWSFACPSQAALAGEKVHRNPLFHPSLCSVGHYANAPSARLLQVGDRDSMTEDGTNFSPRIVSFRGMQPLPEGELWGYPSFAAEYPLIAFHLPPDEGITGFTLCFEDRDGLKGLHSYYDNDLKATSEAGIAELTLQLQPHEVAELMRPEGGEVNLRSIFRLRSSCGELRGTLRSIERGAHDQGKVCCTFNRIDR